MRPLALAATLALALALPLVAQIATTPPTANDATLKTSSPVSTKTSATTKHYVAKHYVAKHSVAKASVAKSPVAKAATAKPVAAPAPHIAAAPPEPAPFSENPILQLHGNARALLIFAPDTSNPALRRQMELLLGHDLELSKRNTVFVPIITQHHGTNEVVFGENIRSGSYRDQLSARRKFGIKYNEFAIILLDKDGTEQFRSTTPVPMTNISTAIDGTPGGGQ